MIYVVLAAAVTIGCIAISYFLPEPYSVRRLDDLEKRIIKLEVSHQKTSHDTTAEVDNLYTKFAKLTESLAKEQQ